MEIVKGLNNATKLPSVMWKQRRAYIPKGWRKLFGPGRVYDSDYKMHFYGIDIVEEEVTLLMMEDWENANGAMKLMICLPPREVAEEIKDHTAFLGVPMQEVRSFVLEVPPEPIRQWKSASGFMRQVPRPSAISLDTGGGELLKIAQHFDRTGNDMPYLRRVLQEMFVDHPLVREWHEKFRGGKARAQRRGNEDVI